MAFTFLCKTYAMHEGGMGFFQVGKKSVMVLWPAGGEPRAFRGRCPHADVPLENEATFNGQIVTAQAVNPDGTIVLTDGRILPSEFRTFTHGYGVTSAASQGRTVDHVFVAMDSLSFHATNRNQFYVSTSRGRELVRIFTDDKEFLQMVVNRPGERLSALELVESARRAERKSIKQNPAVKVSPGL